MVEQAPSIPASDRLRGIAQVLDRAAFGLFILVLAWAPFPLGSNRPWSWSLLCLLIAACWGLWWVSTLADPRPLSRIARGLRIPIALGTLALLWGVVQTLPFVPESWAHPVWQLADTVLGTHGGAAISLSPWRTTTEVMKLTSYGMVVLLVRVFASRAERANFLLNALILIAALYAAYAIGLAAFHFQQFNVFYAAPATVRMMSGPFVNPNSFATFAGLGALCAGVRLIERASVAVAPARSWRDFALALINYIFGRGVFYLVATALAITVLLATGSRAGTLAFFAGVAVLFVFSLILGLRQSRALWVTGVAAAAFVGLIALFSIDGSSLATGFNALASSGMRGDVRLLLWGAAARMIEDAPLLGLGLGSYIHAYPLYSDTVVQFIMDKAHNDYLEMAAGWGLPAAILWLSAIAWLVGLCVKGVFQRRRHRAYPMLAVGAAALVGFHSIFDFSLQMPAVSLLFATILGLGVAQAFSTRGRA